MHRLSSPIFLSSHVVHGFGRGSKQLGIPTANLEEDVVQGLQLDNGIYYGFAQLLHQSHSGSTTHQPSQPTENGNSDEVIHLPTSPGLPIFPMVCSLGWNPQFGNAQRSLEAHILHKFDSDFYGSLLRIAICGYIRPEQKFESIDKLISTIHSDIAFARKALQHPRTCWSHVINDRFFQV